MMKNIVFAILALVPIAARADEPKAEIIATEPPAAAATATAAAGWRFAVAPRVGLTIPTSSLGAMVVGGLELDFALPVAQRRLVVALDLSVTQPGHDGQGSDPRTGAYTFSISETELKVGLDLLYRVFTADHRLVPYGGAGLVMHMLKTTETNSMAPGDNTAQDTNFGFEIVGGVDYKLGPGLLLGELRIVYTGLDHLWTGDTNAGNVTVGVGYRFIF